MTGWHYSVVSCMLPLTLPVSFLSIPLSPLSLHFLQSLMVGEKVRDVQAVLGSQRVNFIATRCSVANILQDPNKAMFNTVCYETDSL